MNEFRIEFSITRRRDGEGDFTEIGFGSSGAWSDVDACAHAIDSMIQNGIWGTEPGMPSSSEIRASGGAS